MWKTSGFLQYKNPLCSAFKMFHVIKTVSSILRTYLKSYFMTLSLALNNIFKTLFITKYVSQDFNSLNNEANIQTFLNKIMQHYSIFSFQTFPSLLISKISVFSYNLRPYPVACHLRRVTASPWCRGLGACFENMPVSESLIETWNGRRPPRAAVTAGLPCPDCRQMSLVF